MCEPAHRALGGLLTSDSFHFDPATLTVATPSDRTVAQAGEGP